MWICLQWDVHEFFMCKTNWIIKLLLNDFLSCGLHPCIEPLIFSSVAYGLNVSRETLIFETSVSFLICCSSKLLTCIRFEKTSAKQESLLHELVEGKNCLQIYMVSNRSTSRSTGSRRTHGGAAQAVTTTFAEVSEAKVCSPNITNTSCKENMFHVKQFLHPCELPDVVFIKLFWHTIHFYIKVGALYQECTTRGRKCFTWNKYFDFSVGFPIWCISKLLIWCPTWNTCLRTELLKHIAQKKCFTWNISWQ